MRNRREAELTKRILSETREELARADGKASLLLAAATVVIGAALTAVLANGWRPWSLPHLLWVVWWLGVALGAGALVALGVAVYPATVPKHARRDGMVAYWGDIAGQTIKDLSRRLAESSKNGDRDTDQLLAISDIVRRKYLAIRIGIWLFALAGALDVASVVVGRYWH